MRIMSKYYTHIRMRRMAELLDLTEDVCMKFVQYKISFYSIFIIHFYSNFCDLSSYINRKMQSCRHARNTMNLLYNVIYEI